MVVDDSVEDRAFLRGAFREFPRFRFVAELGSGEEAVDYLIGEGRFGLRDAYPLPDLVLLDLKMPCMDGYEFLRWLRLQSFPGLTVIVLSHSALQQDVQVSLTLGAHGYWSKGASPEKQRLIALEIETLLDGRSDSMPEA